ncbi:hypothetical protein BGZ95_006950 [Linnemannia exigua]|uniref:DDE Tnp4 domain-containing protein n=1 Tax=Linnemannia exigua TaxID=604196 RepID=A0AAD4D0J3_9FUNG|nr:hypothetical protein BGZ95_006950 [Linnemannia exigua]
MPRTSDRQRLILDLRMGIMLAEAEDDEEEVEELAASLFFVESARFLSPTEQNRRARLFFDEQFDNTMPHHFKALFRTTKESFFSLLRLIEGHRIYQNNSRNQQTPAYVQLGVTLSRLGTNGTGSSVAQHEAHFGFSAGAVVDFTRRTISALMDHRDEWIQWPDERRREEISQVMELEGFPGCVGFIDGTTLPLSQKPALDGEVYFDRKKICDIDRRIIAYHVGRPGSSGDSLVFKRMNILRTQSQRPVSLPTSFQQQPTATTPYLTLMLPSLEYGTNIALAF